jgi:hypothetical protein
LAQRAWSDRGLHDGAQYHARRLSKSGARAFALFVGFPDRGVQVLGQFLVARALIPDPPTTPATQRRSDSMVYGYDNEIDFFSSQWAD